MKPTANSIRASISLFSIPCINMNAFQLSFISGVLNLGSTELATTEKKMLGFKSVGICRLLMGSNQPKKSDTIHLLYVEDESDRN